ncbi:MAG: murein L,D-transpeptidase [Hoeflea sp.]|nr:murein L,D-transpeptidase [Alphaproteobacteria bacterium]MBV1726222.1 murein L,D-transpeptidase [Hoeflea sp.]MBU4545576.1 murein L,D-transpeptidase [Alphaproteobacteria bacterium]MBU4552186.1 murein L,D-transpeptidase [Alphaproteobacteria bacterium]MBV1762351.1 murein L,D-transpeptidase [Hoeflea sp.]
MRTLRFLPILLLGLTGCQDALDSVSNKVEHPLPAKLVNKMKAQDMSTRSPIMMRIFKEEGVLEVWKQKGNGRFDIIASYEICKWSGGLGPKFKEGDRQAPEGFYRIYPAQMNPKSSYYLSFNMGFPNSYDRSHGRTGTNLMVHGACSSAGCYSMTDEQVLEIYGFARDAFKGGQEYFLVEALPFRMTPENMARHRDSEHFEFWKMLKVGYDHFELTKRPPKVEVCDRQYVFNQIPEIENAAFQASAACPPASVPTTLASAHYAYEKSWNESFLKAADKFDREKARQIATNEAKAAAEARRAEKEAQLAARMATNGGQTASVPVLSLFSTGNPLRALAPGSPPATPLMPSPAETSVASVADPAEAAEAAEVVEQTTPEPALGGIPVPVPNPAASAQVETVQQQSQATQAEKPFWKIWSKN